MGLIKNAFDKIGEFDGLLDIFNLNRTTDKNINYLGTNVDIPVVYGEEELPAIWVGFRKTSEKKFGALAVFCHAPIEGFDWIEINGLRHAPIPNESGFGTDYQYKQNLRDHGIEYKVQFSGAGNSDFHGLFANKDNYPLPTELGTEYPEFFHGLVGVWFEFDVSKGFVTGIPTVTLKTRGRNFIFDPRIDATFGDHYAGWPSYLTFDGSTATACTNPALIRADYLTNKMYGKGLSWDKINVPALIEAANICDTQVLDGDGSNINLMSFAGRLDTSQKIDKNLELIDKHMRAHSPYHNGQFGLVIRDDAPTPDTIPEKWIKKHYEINHGDKSERLNSCLISYKEPAYDLDENQVIWPIPGSEDDLDFLTADGGEVLQEEITLEGCRNRYQAIDYAEAIVRESRLQIETKLDLWAPTLKYQAGDVVDVPLKGVGLTRMRISSVDIHKNLNVTWNLQQHSNDSYPLSLIHI